MALVDILELGKIAAQAKQKAIEVRERRQREDAEKKRRADEEVKSKVEGVLSQVEARCMTEADEGRNHAIVYSVPYGEYELRQPYNQCKPSELKGAAILIYEALMEGGLKPTIEHWHDGCGMKDGFNLVVHF